MTLTEQLRAAAEKATPGLWFWESDGGDLRRLRAPCLDESGIDEYVLRPEHDYHRDRDEIECEPEDAAFIALANPANIITLLDRIAELEGGLEPFAAVCEAEVYPSDTDTSKLAVRVGFLRKARTLLSGDAS